MNFFIGRKGNEYVAYELTDSNVGEQIGPSDLRSLAITLKSKIADGPWEISVNSDSVRGVAPLGVEDRSRILNMIDSRT